IGRANAAERNRPRYTRVDVDRIITFDLPAPLTARKLLSLKQTLAGVGTDLIPEFYLRREERPAGFDFNEYQRLRMRAEASATAVLGWNSRGQLAEYISDYYYLIREIRFRSFVIRLRTAILDRLNAVLATILTRFGRSGKIVLEGFSDVDAPDRLESAV